ncbi:MAG: hypothetical protein FD180_3196 [Planctomycetota bacterium]|nr:MAG: hypothetical protein FD180_3196 [Planctomycetota bacterium]
MTPRPKKHHYVPKSYLAGFTPSGGVEDSLWVHREGKSRKSKPEACAFEREYYSRTEAGTGYSDLESRLGVIEGAGMNVIKGIVAGGRLPGGEELDPLLDFVAIMSTRGPNTRERFDEFVSEVSRKYLIIAKHCESWNKGEHPGHDSTSPSAEEIDEFKKSELGPDHKLLPFLDGVEVVKKCLVGRQWAVWRTAETAARLITTDNPVIIDWMFPTDTRDLPGHAHRHTMLSMPLTKRLLLVGCHEAAMDVQEPMPIEIVACQNGLRLVRARHEAFSCEADFPILLPEKGVVGIQSLAATGAE